jgi:hypothetical protein
MTLAPTSNPDTVSLMMRSGVSSSEHSPSRIIPHRGQVSENTSKPATSEHWAVLHKDVSRLHLANDAGHVRPHSASFAVDTCAFSGRADVLARKAARYDVNNASPWPSVKGLYVIPDRERRQASVILPGNQDARGVCIPLDSAHGAPSKQMSAEYSATSARE